MRKSSHWLEEASPSESVDFYREMAHSHAREGGAIALPILRLIEQNRIRELCEFEMDYTIPGATADSVYHCRQALAYFQKIQDLDIGLDREKAAMAKFLEAEALCKSTNQLLRDRRRGVVQFTSRVEQVIYLARRKIQRILGEVPQFADLGLHFGPGATRATKRKEASTRRKLAEKLQCSEELFPSIPYVLEELPHITDLHSVLDRTDEEGNEWCRVPVEIIPAKLSFVPKNAKSLRSICTEPGLNTIVQLGIGSHMARRLAAFGIDIRDQTLNQRRAREGSLTGDLATLDLSSASDTISTELVFELLPLSWASLLNRARSRKVELPTKEVLTQEKFSSMGNGFTFPLETLIFWSLAASCCNSDDEATAYGDDLVVPTSVYPLLVEVLVAVGFVVNQSKSYHTGLFRESCGKDYFSGTDVRPIYSKGWVTPQSLFVLHNYYVRRGDLERAKFVECHVNETLRVYGPDGFGDGHLLGDHPRRCSPKYTQRGYSGYFFSTFTTRSLKDETALKGGELAVALYSVYRRSAGDVFLATPRPIRTESGRLSAASWPRGYGTDHIAPLALPYGKDDVKHLPLPGVSGYKKISVYTLGD